MAMHKIIIVMLVSACRLMEEPTQQVKGAFTAGEVVFNAQNISSTAAVQCQDADCRRHTQLPYVLHQVALSNDIQDVLQANNLHISFSIGDKQYTCLRRSVPLGKMVLLWGENKQEYCYEQDKDKYYVQQFAAACVGEKDWQLVVGAGASDKKEFACQGGEQGEKIEISSACFVAGNDCSETEGWPEGIKGIHEGAKSAPPTETMRQAITADTLLKDVKIMAEWKLNEDVDCDNLNNLNKTITLADAEDDTKFIKSAGLSRNINPEVLQSDTNMKIGVLESFNTFACQSQSSGIFGADYFIPHGVCINKNTDGVNKLEDCQEETEYIKITFAPKD